MAGTGTLNQAAVSFKATPFKPKDKPATYRVAINEAVMVPDVVGGKPDNLQAFKNFSFSDLNEAARPSPSRPTS